MSGWGTQTISTGGFPNVHDYATAVKAYEVAPQKRGDPNKRWIKAGNGNFWMQRSQTLGIEFYYNGNNHVTWEREGKVRISDNYATLSGEVFINHFTDATLHIGLKGAGSPWVGNYDYAGALGYAPRYWKMKRGEDLIMSKGDGRWEPVSGTCDFLVPEVDKAACGRALKASRYQDFVGWARAVINLNGFRDLREEMTKSRVDPHAATPAGRETLLTCLADETLWPAILTATAFAQRGTEGSLALRRAVDAIRHTVYITQGCVKIVKQPHLDGSKAIETWHRKAQEYSDLVRDARHG